MDVSFSLTSVGYSISVLLLLGLAFLVLLKDPKKQLNQLFFGLAGSSALFGLSLIIGTATTNEHVAYVAWLFNLADIFIAIFYAHFMLKVIDRDYAYCYFLILSYVIGIGIVVLATVAPTLFVPEVTPKLGYTFYLNPGPLYHLMVVFFFVIPVPAFLELVFAYFRGGRDRVQSEYFLIASIMGYLSGPLAFLLVYDIPFDPVWVMFYGLWTAPIAYGIVSRQLLDIRLVIKRAAIYAVVIALVASSLAALILLNNYLIETIPGVQVWTVPVLAALVGVFLARFYWIQASEADRLKYEFITIATHKLRTPLTRISWQTKALLEQQLPDDVRESVEDINNAKDDLVEITHVLFEAAKAHDSVGATLDQDIDLKTLVHETVERFRALKESRHSTITIDAPDDVYTIVGDRSQIASVLGIFIENALLYGKEGGSVVIALTKTGADVMCSITDEGIGVSQKDQKHIFERFFRTSAAKLADTEGLGLGLSLAKSVVKRHHGKVGMRSDGEGKGATFWFSIPAK